MTSIATLVLLASLAGMPFEEPRYCGAPGRTDTGKIARSREVLRAFKAQHPCPSTGKATGACPGWAMDHVVPLVCGGCDAVGNLQWLPRELKSARGNLPKDRWEQRAYCKPYGQAPAKVKRLPKPPAPAPAASAASAALPNAPPE